MDIDPKTCLFIGVDIQKVFVKRTPAPAEAMAAITALRSRITVSGARSCQVYMEPTHPDDELMCTTFLGERMFEKTQSWPDNRLFHQSLKRLRPKHLLLYGYYLDHCVMRVAQHAQRTLHAVGCKPSMTFITDCGRCSPRDMRDWEATEPVAYDANGKPYPIITSTQLRFPHERPALQARATPAKANRLRL